MGIQSEPQSTSGVTAGARRGLAAAVGPLACLALILGFFFIARSLGSDSNAFAPFPRPVPNTGESATVEVQASPQAPAALAPSPAAPSPFSPTADGAGGGEEGAPILVSSRGPGAGTPTTTGSGPVSPHTPFPKPTTSSPPPPPPGPSEPAKQAKSAKKHAKADKAPKADKPAKPSKPPKADKPANNGNKGKKAAKPEKAKGGGKSKKH